MMYVTSRVSHSRNEGGRLCNCFFEMPKALVAKRAESRTTEKNERKDIKTNHPHGPEQERVAARRSGMRCSPGKVNPRLRSRRACRRKVPLSQQKTHIRPTAILQFSVG